MLTLNDVCTLITDGSHFSPEDEGTGYPMLSVKDMCDDHFDIINCKYVGEEAFQRLASNGCRPQVNDVVVAKDGSFLKTAFTVKEDQDIALLSSIAILRPKLDLIVPDYLSYYLKSPSIYRTVSLNYISGTALKRIILKGLRKIPMEVPKLEEQYQRVELLNSLKQIIKQRKAEIQKLDDLIKARFVEMFGDPIINSFGIETKPMTDVCEIIDGDRGKNYPTADEFSDEGYCLFLNAKNVTSTGFNFDTCMFVTKEKDEDLHKGKLSRGDVVLTTRGTLGNLAFYTEDIPFEHVRINSGMVILRMKQDVVDEVYFIEQFKMQLVDIREKIASGSAQPQLPISTMNKINILIPDIEKQRQFTDFVKQVDKLKLLSLILRIHIPCFCSKCYD